MIARSMNTVSMVNTLADVVLRSLARAKRYQLLLCASVIVASSTVLLARLQIDRLECNAIRGESIRTTLETQALCLYAFGHFLVSRYIPTLQTQRDAALTQARTVEGPAAATVARTTESLMAVAIQRHRECQWMPTQRSAALLSRAVETLARVMGCSTDTALREVTRRSKAVQP